MAKKQKSNNCSNGSSISFAYKNFNSSNKKRRNQKNLKSKYFEHDTRTRTKLHSGISSVNGTAAIKKFKFNNEINIYETKHSTTTTTTTALNNNNNNNVDNSKCETDINNSQKSKSQKMIQRKRIFYKRRHIPTANSNIQSTTKKLQKQLIETQKKLQKQLIALQDHQREQNKSFLALIRSNCMHSTTPNSNNHNIIGDSETIIDQNHISNFGSNNLNNKQSELFCKHFLDDINCSNDNITAKGNDTMAIR